MTEYCGIVDPTFLQDLAVAALGGLVAAGGGAVAVFKQLAASENRRVQRDRALNEAFTETRMLQLEALRFLQSLDPYIRPDARIASMRGTLTNDLIHDAREARVLLRRASWWDARVIRKAWAPIEQRSQLADVHKACRHSRRHLERRLRGTNFAIRFVSSMLEKRRPPVGEHSLAEAIQTLPTNHEVNQ